jgi:hypothetical protein
LDLLELKDCQKEIAENFAVVRRIALNALKKLPLKMSFKEKKV